MARSEYIANDYMAERAQARKLSKVKRSARTTRASKQGTRGAFIVQLLTALMVAV